MMSTYPYGVFFINKMERRIVKVIKDGLILCPKDQSTAWETKTFDLVMSKDLAELPWAQPHHPKTKSNAES